MRAAISMVDNPSTANMALWVKAIAMGGGQLNEAVEFAERMRMPDRVKAAVAPHLSTDSDQEALANTRTILTSFAPLLRNSSAFFRLLDGSMMMRAPLRQRVSYLTSAAQVTRVGEAQAIKVQRSALDSVNLDPMKATSILVFSEELLNWLSTAGEAFLSNELRKAISAGVDVGFFAAITDGSTPTQASSGSTESAALADCYALFEAVQITAESKPLFVMSPDVGRRAATLIGGGGRAFPLMGPTGGEMCGVPAMAVDGLSAGTLGLIDGAGIAGDAEGVEIKSAKHASLQLSDSPDSPATTSTTMISLWQRNLTGVMPSIYFAAQRLRDNAFATISAVQWNASGNSPT